MKRIIFDIETGPLEESKIAHLAPEFKAPANYKDEAKIAEYIASAKKAWLEDAALDPLTGQVLCIGFEFDGGAFTLLGSNSEHELLEAFWKEVWSESLDYVVGFNIKHFDLPFLVRRSWANGVPVPEKVRDGRYWSPRCIDLMELWQLGNIQERKSLDKICQFLGLGCKNGDGKDFHKLWKEDNKKAVEYVQNDLLLTKKLADVLLPAA